MNPHTLRYRIRPEKLEDHEQQLIELAADLATSPVPGLRYEVFRLNDGLEYLHIIAYDKVGHGPLQRPPTLTRFHEELRDRCENEPHRETLEPIVPGDYERPPTEHSGRPGQHE